ncbi:MAG: hydroxypyruvate isomerase, partial [Verrucomicrobiaceae bacterium]
MFNSPLSRRTFLSASAIAATAASLQQRLSAADAASGLKGKINHSACKWCYPKVSLEEFCVAGKEIGLTAIDLIAPNDFPTLKK